MATWMRWTLGLGIAVLLSAVPLVYYRAEYAHAKRLREVDPGRVYRSGQLTAAGFEEAILRFGIRTIINAQDEYPDPDLPFGYFDRQVVPERDLCLFLGARYVHLAPDLLPRHRVPRERPAAIERFLEIMDNPESYPVLIHCKAGLHRSGCLVALYHMEYQGWSASDAMQDLRDNGFGDTAASAANDYIAQYILGYRPGQRFKDIDEKALAPKRDDVSAPPLPLSSRQEAP